MKGRDMNKATHALALLAGCLAGAVTTIILFSECFVRECDNLEESGFHCSRCHSHTDYQPKEPFRFCPMCGALCMKRGRVL